ncbi:MAG: hypothetical protein Q9201_004964 [Fulgogasparrea decipioides]
MEEFLESGNAFAIPDLWQQSLLANLEAQEPPPETDELSPFKYSTEKEPTSRLLSILDISFALPKLDVPSDDPLQTFKSLEAEQEGAASFAFGPLEDVEPLEFSAVSSDHEEHEESVGMLEDLWSFKEILEPLNGQLEVKSWEKFHNKNFQEPRTVYISAAGPRVFDAFLSRGFTKSEPVPALRSDAVLSSLLQLALGRESLLYRYDEKTANFLPVVEDIRMSGYSPESFNSLGKELTCHGSQIRRAKNFINDMRSSRKTTASSIALASGIDIILTALDAHLSGPLTSLRTVLQLQVLLEQPKILLECLSHIVNKAEELDNVGLLSMLFDFVQGLEYSTPCFQMTMNQLLAHVSRPWLVSVEHSLGLGVGHGLHTTSMEDQDVTLEAEAYVEGIQSRMPNFISRDIIETLMEAEQSLKLLQTHEPEHLLARPNTLSSLEPPSLQWQFSWQDIDKIQAQAEAFEFAVFQALKEFNDTRTFTLPQKQAVGKRLGPPNQDPESQSTFTDDLSQIESALSTLLSPPTPPLYTTVIAALNTTEPTADPLATPPLALTPSLSLTPLLSTQSRLVSHSTLHLLFRTHSLRTHLRLLHSYPLFANGTFLVRLSHALFDPSLPSAAYQKGRIRTAGAGLRLGGRETWPPASSELRIALMGILTESYNSSFPDEVGKDGGGKNDGELPGDLSFAIRGDMSDEKLEKCMNPDGVEALDFLKISYRPPKPLDVVITDTLLEKYDRVSRLLLRGARLLFAVKEMMIDDHHNDERRQRNASKNKTWQVKQRFKFETHHFVTTVFSYFATTIQESWTAFENHLDAIETMQLDRYEVGMKVEGIQGLKALHEEVMDRILAGCLLRRKQEAVMGLLEEILGLVLRFKGMSRGDEVREEGNGEGDGGESVGGEQVEKLYEVWRKKVRLFITVCKGLREQKSLVGNRRVWEGGKGQGDMGNGIGRLVLGLEGSGWYMR